MSIEAVRREPRGLAGMRDAAARLRIVPSAKPPPEGILRAAKPERAEEPKGKEPDENRKEEGGEPENEDLSKVAVVFKPGGNGGGRPRWKRKRGRLVLKISL
ncbi:MAG: hypothetical protein AB1657_03235 [Candidatus Micrarchaeota archaeon]